MISKTGIANLALRHLGHSTEIQDIEADATAAATACRRFYDQARDEVLSEFPWPFATRFGSLALVEEDPTIEWNYSYRYPTDCLHVRRILNGASRVESIHSRVKYRIAADDDGVLIFTDEEDAEAEWTHREDNTGRYPSLFVQAFALLLASYIAPAVTGGDPSKLGTRAYNLYTVRLSAARATALNEESPDQPPDSEFVLTRD